MRRGAVARGTRDARDEGGGAGKERVRGTRATPRHVSRSEVVSPRRGVVR
eukprot:CAMPEP_0175986154 /NCGR_PEP_ID=MMETSP0108-20121206/49989_1 /TAXON_ID=195067 ORGANISM="Goniomonas pacifica, Strain CCMP1869" /NCGR_SAMPLE_ID=MMETSP0108 /ASSEMBLY_ACC=CAM_ASM_000204 /LENGTH=49 /DNA_ID= /DNA_START= /DNA_END= /DNA_ORIENTATION=